jgi:undecaprenol kinase
VPDMKFKDSFKFAFLGLKKGLFLQRNIRIQFVIAIIVTILSFVFRLDRLSIAVIILVCSAILALEMINSALEKYIDYVTPQRAKEIGLVKDILAGAVLLLSIASVAIGILLFFEPVMRSLIKK